MEKLDPDSAAVEISCVFSVAGKRAVELKILPTNARNVRRSFSTTPGRGCQLYNSQGWVVYRSIWASVDQANAHAR